MEYARDDKHVYRHVAGEHLLIAIHGDADEPLFAMTPTAAELWTQLATWSTFDQLVERLTSRYDVPRERAVTDVGEFLDQLDEVRALRRRGE